MLMKITRILFSLIFLAPTMLIKADEVWLRPITLSARSEVPIRDIPEEDFFEVSTSKSMVAREWLKDASYRSLGYSDAKYLGIGNISCREPRQIYLVRALYNSDGAGSFAIRRFGSNLLVVHDVLGSSSVGKAEKTALVVCLDFQPSDVFGELSGAM